MKVKKYSAWISILRLLAEAHDRRVEQERRAFVVAISQLEVLMGVHDVQQIQPRK